MPVSIVRIRRTTGSRLTTAGRRHFAFVRGLRRRYGVHPTKTHPAERDFERRRAAATRVAPSAPAHQQIVNAVHRFALTVAPRLRIHIRTAFQVPVNKLRPPRPRPFLILPQSVAFDGRQMTIPGQPGLPVIPLPQKTTPKAPGPQPTLNVDLARRDPDGPPTPVHAGEPPGTLITRRLETLVRQTRKEVVGQLAAKRGRDAVAVDGTPVPVRLESNAPSPPAQKARFSDAEVRRVTDQVVQQINRRIIAQRERMGRI